MKKEAENGKKFPKKNYVCTMKLLDSIKQKYGMYVIKKHINSHRKICVFNNFETAKTVGILFDATHQESYLVAKSFIASIRLKNVEVEALGYVRTRDAITYYPYHKGTDFFSLDDKNWHFKPKSSSVTSFCSKKYDILVDLTMEENLSLKFVVAFSEAKMKIGIGTPENLFYDLSLDMKKESTLDFYISQINHYMSILRKAS